MGYNCTRSWWQVSPVMIVFQNGRRENVYILASSIVIPCCDFRFANFSLPWTNENYRSWTTKASKHKQIVITAVAACLQSSSSRLHGSPEIYKSPYSDDQIAALAGQLCDAEREGRQCWCIFDNTALGWAARNAVDLLRFV